ncbi:MAG: dTMP kinase [Candidatus Hydrothermarchaeaceae archaeon]
MFIAVEGIDGSGKGTQCRLLSRWVKDKGHDTFLTREPTGGKIGLLLREVLKKGELEPRAEALLFAADRTEHVKEISQKLAEGQVVISERYFYSSIAYQGASGVSVKWLLELNRFAPVPDLVLYLDVQPEVGLERISSINSLRSSMREKEYFEKQDFLGRVRDLYLDLASEHDFAVISADGTIDEVQTVMRRRVSRVLVEKEDIEKMPRQKGLRDF